MMPNFIHTVEMLDTSLCDDLIDYYHNIIVNYWTFPNYIFGGGMFQIVRPEMDFIDLYLFLGLIGIIAYIYIFKKYIFNFTTHDKSLIFLCLVLILLTVSSSEIIFSGNFALLLIIARSYYYFDNKNII